MAKVDQQGIVNQQGTRPPFGHHGSLRDEGNRPTSPQDNCDRGSKGLGSGKAEEALAPPTEPLEHRPDPFHDPF